MPEIKTSTPYDYQATPEGPGTTLPLQPEDSQSEDKQSARFKTLRSIISTVALFLAAPVLALILIIFVIQSYEVDGPSMQNTLHNHDLLIVDKLPRTFAKITGHSYIPPRYQIVIFTLDESGGTGGQSRQLVKRVIALPGERVTVKNGKVTVYNSQHPEGFNPDEGQEYAKGFTTVSGNVDFTIQPDQVFVMGDNRANSLDSRYFGPIDADTLVGKLGVRIFPINQARRF